MSGLALMLRAMGFTVWGSDAAASLQTARLEQRGVRVFIGHDAGNLKDAEVVVVNSAIPPRNPELCEAKRRGLPVYGRADVLAQVAACFENTIGIAGCHGKTTATAMCAHVMEECSGDCSAHIGGEDFDYCNLYLGGEKYFVTEACEYMGNFLHLRPDVAVILNTDADHLDYYGNAERLAAAYRGYACGARAVIVCGEDPVSKDLKNAVRFGMGKNFEIGAENVRSNGGKYSFLLRIKGEIFDKIRLNVYGKHNIYNALAAIAVADHYGYPAELAVRGLQKFRGIRRRFEFLGDMNGAQVIADYAHHPKEIEASLRTAREVCGGRLFVIFQPHTYSRTRLLFDEFVRVLSTLENLVIYKTYAAREYFDAAGSALTLSESLPNSLYVESLRQLKLYLKCTLMPGDVALILGAGDIYFIAKRLLSEDRPL